ncbi:MAG TPA: sigma-70 family RNA polymerase sigma factor [Planctomycetota bacterium]|nr:sigma-70 family RNA polymerase sigma factor [Planctomycetota bacterium]
MQDTPNAPHQDVPDLLRRWFEQHDQTALDQLLARNLDYLRRYAHGRLADNVRRKEDTGDVIQDAVIEFLRYSPPFVVATEAQLRGLLCKIVDGVLSGHHRWFARMRRQVAKEKPLPDGTSVVFQPFVARDPSPSAAVRGGEREAAVRLAIATLDPIDQKIVWMRIYEDRAFAAIGDEVGMKEDSVRVRCNRAIAKISQKLLAMKRGDVDEFLA